MSQTIHQHLLEHEELTLNEAYDIARALEYAQNNSDCYRKTSIQISAVMHSKDSNKKLDSSSVNATTAAMKKPCVGSKYSAQNRECTSCEKVKR